MRVAGADGSQRPLERTGRGRARASSAEGEWQASSVLCRTRARGRRQPASLRREFDVARPARLSDPLRDRPRRLPGRDQRRPVDDQVLKPGWTAYQFRIVHETTDVTGLLTAGPQRDRRVAGRRLVHRAASASRATRSRSTASSPLRRPTGARLRGRPHRDRRHRRRLARHAPTARSAPAASTTARTTTRAGPMPAGRDRASTTARMARRPASTPATGRLPVARTGRPCGASRRSRSQEVLTTPERPHHPRLRAEPRRPPAHPRLRPRRRHRHPAPRRGARARRARRAAAAARRGHRPLHLGGRRDRDLGAASSPSTASATPRSTAGPASSTRPHVDRGRHPHRHGAHRLVRLLATTAEPAARERGLGHARQLPLPADRLPAARRAPGLDRRHPGLRPDRRVPVRLRRLPRLLAGGPRARAARDRRRAVRRAGRARHPAEPAAAWGDAATVVPWVLYERFGDLGLLARAVSRACAPGSTRSLELAGPRRLWEGGFQFGDWLDPDAPPDARQTPRPTPDIVATAYLFRSSRRWSPRPRRARRMKTAPPLRATGRGGARGLAPRVRDPGRPHRVRRADRVRARDRVRASPPTRTPLARMGDRLAWLVRRRRLPDRHRLRRHAAHPGRAQSRPATSTPPPGCCCRPRCRRGCTRSPWARPRSGSAGTACSRTARSTRAR